eukprot:688288-Prorocentrum_minimum.AAC.1
MDVFLAGVRAISPTVGVTPDGVCGGLSAVSWAAWEVAECNVEESSSLPNQSRGVSYLRCRTAGIPNCDICLSRSQVFDLSVSIW